MPRTATGYRKCPCGTRIVWASRSDQPGRKIRLDWQPGTGTFASYQDAAGTWHARSLAPGEQPYRHEQIRAAHHTTCERNDQ